MRRFLLKSILLFFIFISFTGLLLCLSTQKDCKEYIAILTGSTDYLEGYNQGPIEIIPYIHQVSQKDATTKLILGDSVTFRMYSELKNYNPDFCIAGSNRGVTMSGQYILLHEYLANHPDATDVYLILIEDSLLTTYETGYGYQYAVQPFLMTDTLSLLDEKTIRKMKHTYGSLAVNKKAAYFLNESPLGKKLYLNLLNNIHPVSSTYEISSISNQYIPKMYELCTQRGVTMHLLPNPLCGSLERHAIEDEIKNNYENSDIYPLFPDYFNELHYYDPSLFPDKIHPSVSREQLDDMIRDLNKSCDGALSALILPSTKDEEKN